VHQVGRWVLPGLAPVLILIRPRHARALDGRRVPDSCHKQGSDLARRWNKGSGDERVVGGGSEDYTCHNFLIFFGLEGNS
jgi:hypothetical protein